jgi:hypothetical protein
VQLFLGFFQIASVSHSKGNTKILDPTVLKPIGESLRRIFEGGRFIVSHDTNDSLSLKFYVKLSTP